jgi:hypothetical protein
MADQPEHSVPGPGEERWRNLIEPIKPSTIDFARLQETKAELDALIAAWRGLMTLAHHR